MLRVAIPVLAPSRKLSSIMDNKISNSNEYKYSDDIKVENLENEDILHKYKYKLQDEDISLNFVLT